MNKISTINHLEGDANNCLCQIAKAFDFELSQCLEKYAFHMKSDEPLMEVIQQEISYVDTLPLPSNETGLTVLNDANKTPISNITDLRKILYHFADTIDNEMSKFLQKRTTKVEGDQKNEERKTYESHASKNTQHPVIDPASSEEPSMTHTVTPTNTQSHPSQSSTPPTSPPDFLTQNATKGPSNAQEIAQCLLTLVKEVEDKIHSII